LLARKRSRGSWVGRRGREPRLLEREKLVLDLPKAGRDSGAGGKLASGSDSRQGGAAAIAELTGALGGPGTEVAPGKALGAEASCRGWLESTAQPEGGWTRGRRRSRATVCGRKSCLKIYAALGMV
jgi:hypothetical protein